MIDKHLSIRGHVATLQPEVSRILQSGRNHRRLGRSAGQARPDSQRKASLPNIRQYSLTSGSSPNIGGQIQCINTGTRIEQEQTPRRSDQPHRLHFAPHWRHRRPHSSCNLTGRLSSKGKIRLNLRGVKHCTRVLGPGSGTFRTLHRPEAPSFGASCRGQASEGQGGLSAQGLNRMGSGIRSVGIDRRPTLVLGAVPARCVRILAITGDLR
jgi:hypothetical protein